MDSSPIVLPYGNNARLTGTSLVLAFDSHFPIWKEIKIKLDTKQIEKLLREEEAAEKKQPGSISQNYLNLLRDALALSKASDVKGFNRELNAPYKKAFQEKLGEYIGIFQKNLRTKESERMILSGSKTLLDIRVQLRRQPDGSSLLDVIEQMGQIEGKKFKPLSDIFLDNVKNLSDYYEKIAGQNLERQAQQAGEMQIQGMMAANSDNYQKFMKGLSEDQRARIDQESMNTLSDIMLGHSVVMAVPGVEIAKKVKLLRAISWLQEFYFENMLFPEDRFRFRNIDQTSDLVNSVAAVFTEFRDSLGSLKGHGLDTASYNNYVEFFNKAESQLKTDLDRMVTTVRYNNWADWAERTQVEQDKLDEYMRLGKQELMRKYGLKTDEQFYFMAMLENNPDRFKDYPNKDAVLYILGLDGTKLPTSVQLDNETVNFQKKLEDAKKKIVDLAVTTVGHYVPENDKGATHYLNQKEIEELSKKTQDLLGSELGYLRPRVLKEAGIEDPQFENFETHYNSIDRLDTALYNAKRFITENNAGVENDELRPFSMYEIQGQVNPDVNNNMMQHVRDLDTKGQELLEVYQEGDKAVKARLKPAVDALNTLRPMIDKLTKETIPGILTPKADFDTGEVFRPLKPDDLKRPGLTEDFVTSANGLRNYMKIIDEKVEKGEEVSPEEQEVYNSVKQLYQRVAPKVDLLYYLNQDPNGQHLSDEIDEYNYLMSQGKLDGEYAEGQIKHLNYVMNCRQLMADGQFYPQFLFEDPQSPRASSIVSLKLGLTNRQQLNAREEEINRVPWNADGTRNINVVSEYMLQEQQLGTRDDLIQYATKNDREGFEKIVDDCLRDMPDFLHRAMIVYKDVDPNDLTKTIERRERIDVEKKIRDHLAFYKNDSVQSLMEFSDGTPSEGGLLDAFDPDELNRRSVRDFVERINRNLLNAGYGKAQQELLDSPSIPNGYNEGNARNAQSAFFQAGDMMPDTGLLEGAKFPHANSKAGQDNYSDVVVVSQRRNYDSTSLDGETFYTTTKDFRKSDFVGILPDNKQVDGLLKELQGKSGKEMAEILSAKEGQKEGDQPRAEKNLNDTRKVVEDLRNAIQEAGKDPKSTRTNKNNRSYLLYDTGKQMAAMADLQVMDYLSGIPVRSTDGLRLGFKKDEKGNPQLDSVTAANTKDKPFLNLSPEEEKKLVQPEDMLVMTREMRDKVVRWREQGLSEAEKASFGKLPKECFQSFQNRLDKLYNVVKASEDHKFRDYDANGMAMGMGTERGKIRVLEKEDFKKLMLDDLSLGKNSVNPRDMENAPYRNLFDTLSDMPKACNRAMVDKLNARFVGSTSKEFGADIPDGKDFNSAQSFHYKFTRDTSISIDMQFAQMETERLIKKVVRTGGRMIDMDNHSDDAYGWHKLFGNSKLFDRCFDAAKEMQETIVEVNELIGQEDEYLRNRNAFRQKYGDKAVEAVERERAERLKFAQDLAREQGNPIPQELPKNTSADLCRYRKIVEKMHNYRENIENYLVSRQGANSDFGKARYRDMIDTYNRLNRNMAEFTMLTGDTRFSPREATVDADYKLHLSNMYADRTEFEMTTPYYYTTRLKQNVSFEKMILRQNEAMIRKGEMEDNVINRKEFTEFTEEDLQEAREAAPAPNKKRTKIDFNELAGKEPEANVHRPKKTDSKKDLQNGKNEIMDEKKPSAIGP